MTEAHEEVLMIEKLEAVVTSAEACSAVEAILISVIVTFNAVSRQGHQCSILRIPESQPEHK